jgi:uncharacterized protein (DUF433 family)
MLELKNPYNNKKERIIPKDPKILNGTPVFNGTRVPINFFFDYLKNGEIISKLLEDFPSVDSQKINKILVFAEEVFSDSFNL